MRMLRGSKLVQQNPGLTAAMSVFYISASASHCGKAVTFTVKLHSFDIQMQIYIQMEHILYTADLILSTLICTTGRGGR